MTKHLSLHIEGMSCDGCVRSVTKALLRTHGVSEAIVSLPTKTANITIDDEVFSLVDAKREIEEIGYQVT